jgi:hypothetical protein
LLQPVTAIRAAGQHNKSNEAESGRSWERHFTFQRPNIRLETSESVGETRHAGVV